MNQKLIRTSDWFERTIRGQYRENKHSDHTLYIPNANIHIH